ncbi:MAG: hypothetical protein D6732_27595 [Methanobacteriota archaeon]|nr:MAG: hypothetical protein D6732_27595 [Euryarchaeota archaeon]
MEELDTVQNHRSFTILPFDENFTARFHPTFSGVTLQNNLLSAPPGTDPPNDVIDFKDPWLIDYPDPQYGNNKRNQGMNAPFKSRPAPFNPDYTTSYNGDVYQGVFLNQPYTGNNPVFYSVRAVDGQQITVNGKSITYDWESWGYDPDSISLQSPTSRTTAVVFKQDGATLTANLKGRRVSDTPQATAGSNAFHLVA